MRAVIFDFDGVIANSEPVHEAAIRAALRDLGLAAAATWTDWSRYVGHGDREAFRRMLADAGMEPLFTPDLLGRFKAQKKVRFEERLATDPPPAYPGSAELIRAAAAAPGLAIAVCSGSRPHEILPILRRLEVEGLPRAITTADDVANTKPDPEPYSLSARRLGLSPADCVAIEDTPVGVSAARAAGCVVVAVEQTQPGAALRAAGAHAVAPAMINLSVDLLRDFWRAHQAAARRVADSRAHLTA